MDNRIFEIKEEDQETIYAKVVISLFKSLFKESVINENEYDLLIKEICRTFNLS